MNSVFIGFLIFFSFGIATLEARVFTDTRGRTVDGEIVSATESTVQIQKKDGSMITVALKKLSNADQAFVKEFRAAFIKKMLGKGGAISSETAPQAVLSGAAEKIVLFVKQNIGRQVGNGECWTLANEAYKSAHLERPGKDLRVWGRLVDYRKELLQPGDIIELEAATFGNGMKFFGNHTSVVVAADAKGNFTVLEQNINGKRFVQQKTYQLSDLKTGSLKVYRYAGTN